MKKEEIDEITRNLGDISKSDTGGYFQRRIL